MSTGRYAGCATLVGRDRAGRVVQYLAPRILPQGSPASAGTTSVEAGEVHRLDLVALRALRNVDLAWRLADANDAMDPFELVARPGTVLRLPVSAL